MNFKYFLILQLFTISVFSSEGFSGEDLKRVTYERKDYICGLSSIGSTIFNQIEVDGQKYVPTQTTSIYLSRGIIAGGHFSDNQAKTLILTDYLANKRK